MQIRSNLKTRHKRSPGVVVNASQGLIRGEDGGANQLGFSGLRVSMLLLH